MRYLICIILIFGLVSTCFAENFGRVCLKKGTGELIEFQTGDAPLGTLTLNALNAGFEPEEVEEKYVTKEEWEQIAYEQIKKPAEDKLKEKKAKQEQKKEKVKQKLGWTEQEWQDLVEALGD